MVDETKRSIEKQFDSLLKSGSQILMLFEAEQTIEEKHIRIIREWMGSAIDLIEPAMPPGSAQYESLKSIRATYEQVTRVLPGNPAEDIRKVLSGLQTARKYFSAWCESDSSQVRPAARARACHGALNESWRFTRDNLIETIKGKEDGRTKRTATLHSYGRMYSWVQSMVVLGNEDNTPIAIIEHVFALAGCLRAIFELFLDIHLLACEKVENGPEKFFSFEKVARHRVANNSLRLHKDHGHLTEDQVKTYSTSGPDIKVEIDKSVVALWGLTKKKKPNRPDHWTGMTVVERAKSLGGDCIRYYQHSYHYCNWCLHSGYIRGIAADQDLAWLLCAHAYSYANEMFLATTRILMNTMDGVLNLEGLLKELEKTKLRGAHILWDMAVRAKEAR